MEKMYKKIISDVAMEISLDKEWRKQIFSAKRETVLEISYKNQSQLPEYIRDYIVTNKLTFYVTIVDECPEQFDEGLIIFKFWAKGYPNICSYSGNNPGIV